MCLMIKREKKGRVMVKEIYKDQTEASRAMAERFVTLAKEAVKDRNRFTVALAGGSSVQTLYELLGSDSYRDRIPWNRTHVFWGDERADRKSTRLNSSHVAISYAVFCLKKKNIETNTV